MPSPFAPFGPRWCHSEVGRAVEHTRQSVFSTLREVFYSLMKGMAEGKCSIELLNGGFPTQSESFTLHLQMEVQFSSVQSLSHVWLFTTPWTTAHQASLSITNSWSPSKPMSIESVMPSNHLILCRPLLLLPSIFPSIRVFSNESALRMRWPKYWSFSFNISPLMNTQDWSTLGWTGWISLQSKGLSRVFSNTTVQKHHSLALSFLYNPTLTSIRDHWKNHSLD